ncbi:MAG: gliding motility-associated C-terminal domain-containing protein [Chitinophagaceae bacterium]|nr:gliding motility-associated C-terminal domain-containing protein [Chitinophagaceae bacterium]
MTLFARFAVILLTLSGLPAVIHAQLCQGSLGDPLVNITFGAGTNPGPQLTAATTSYQFVSTDCPGDGFYTVRSNTANCFGSSWHNLATDHTGDPNGYFMLVNASFQPSAFYLDTVKGLCSGTTYEFAAWVVNVLKSSACNANGIQPNLTFTIERTDGSVIQTYSTGNISNQSSPVWQQWGFFFATPVGVSDIVLRIFNNSPGGCGNDLALDDITFRPCGPQLTSSITGNSSPAVNLCEGTGGSFTFNGALSAGFNNPSLQWQQSLNGGAWTDIPGATATSYSTTFPANTAPAIYSFRLSAAEAGNMSSAKCRVASPALTITIAANPVTNAATNSPLCENETLTLTAGGGTIYQWSGINGLVGMGSSISVNNVQVAQSGKYYVLVTNAAGCTHLDSVMVTVNANPVASVSFTDAAICEGDMIQLQSNGGGTYQWQPANGLSSAVVADPVASPADTIDYSVVVTNQFSCRDTAWVTVNVIERPEADAGPDKYIIKNNSVQLPGSATGQNVSYSWSPAVFINDITSLQPVVTPPHDTTYVLTVISEEGCGTAVDSVHVFVYADVYVPTAFTPNNDGKNDTWFIPALTAYSVYTVSVYNRYGELIFHIKNANVPWDGTYKGASQPAGAYVYVVELKDEKRLLKGILMIVR